MRLPDYRCCLRSRQAVFALFAGLKAQRVHDCAEPVAILVLKDCQTKSEDRPETLNEGVSGVQL